MSITGIAATTATQGVAPIASVSASSASGGGVTYGVGAGAAGGYIAQGPGAGSLVKKMLAGGVVGAGLGFAASFIPGLSFIPHFKLILPAAGAALGALAGGAMHLLSKRKANLAMEAQAQQLGAVQQPTTVTPPATGTTLRVGSHGGATRTLQTNLKKLGLFPHKVTGNYDKATANAVRRFELMKGVQPSGLANPDLRTAVEQDAGLVSQFLVS